jgi:hypothetical protein
VGSVFGKQQPTTVACLRLTHELPDRTPGQPIRVQPQDHQHLVIGSVNGEPVTVDTSHWGPLMIEPVDMSAGEMVTYRGDAIPTGAFHSGEKLGRVELSLYDDVPVMLQPPQGDPIWARPIGPVTVEVAQTDVGLVPKQSTMPAEYVNFDDVYAAAEAPQT